MKDQAHHYSLPQPRPVAGAEVFRLSPFKTDGGPLKLLEVRRGKDRELSPWWTLVAAPIGITMLIVVAAIQGTLASPQGWDVISHDMRAIVGAETSATPAAFPLLRDTASLLITVMLLLCLPQLSKQWRLIRSLWSDLVGAGIVVFDDWDRTTALFSRCNDRFRRLGAYSLAPFILALSVALTLVMGQKVSGVFRTFGPFTDPESGLPIASYQGAQLAYENWWASVSNPLGFSTYVIVATFALYYVCLQNYVGIEFCILALRVRRNIEVWPDNCDPESYGWRNFGMLMRTVVNAMALTAGALTVLFVILPGEAVVWIGVPMLMWIIGATMYLGTPAVLLIPAMRRWRNVAFRHVTAAAKRSNSGEIPFEDVLLINDIYRHVSHVTVLPFRYKCQAVLAYLFPVILGVYQICLAWREN